MNIISNRARAVAATVAMAITCATLQTMPMLSNHEAVVLESRAVPAAPVESPVLVASSQ